MNSNKRDEQQVNKMMNDKMYVDEETANGQMNLNVIDQADHTTDINTPNIIPLENLIGFQNVINPDSLNCQSNDQYNMNEINYSNVHQSDMNFENTSSHNEIASNDNQTNTNLQTNCRQSSDHTMISFSDEQNHLNDSTFNDASSLSESQALNSEHSIGSGLLNDKESSMDDNSQIDESNGKKRRTTQTDTIKKKKARKWGKNSVIDKNKLTMFDLISYNPPASDKQLNDETMSANDREQENENRLSRTETNDFPTVEHKSDTEEEESDEEESIGPRVKINENGEIVLDEASLIVKRKKPKEQNIKTVYEDDKTLSTRTNYSSFKKPGKTNEKKLRWTDDETVKFYTALTIIGTDFTLMSELFFRDKRSRVDLKNKFKQEEKIHKVLIDNALKKSDLTSIQNLENFNFDLCSSDDSDSENSKTKDINNLTTTTAS